VYGIPGFESGASTEKFVFDEHISEDEAIDIAAKSFNVVATSALRLDTERDDSFRLDTTEGVRVLKIAHPADQVGVIDLQLRAMKYVNQTDPSLPIQKIVTTPQGGSSLILSSGRAACMLEWLEGDLLLGATTGPHELAALGDTLGRVSKALDGYGNPDAARLSAWEIRTVPRLKTLLQEVPNDAAAEAIERFTARVVPELDRLPRQVIHNDFNPGNVLVDANDPAFVVGVLDFGDVIYSLRAADLAIGLSYQVYPFDHPWDELAPMIDAFVKRVPLSDLERSLLPTLVIGRFAERVLINQWIAIQENEPWQRYEATTAALAALLTLEA
jgi:hydroxylysine kinase